MGGLAQQIPLLLVNVSLTLVGALFKSIEILLIAFFWLTATTGLKPFVVGLLPAAAQEPARAILAELSHDLGGYLRGVVINMIVIGLLSGAGLAVLGVPYPMLLGVIAGLTEVLPIVGPWISGSVAVLVALATHGLLKGVEVAALFIVIQTLEGNTLVPYVMSRTTALNPLIVLVAVLAGGSLMGLVGAVLAVVLEVLVLRVLAPAARHASQRASAAPSPAPLGVADLRLDARGRQAWRGERALELSAREFDLLECLMQHAGQVLTHRELLEQVWGSDFEGESNAVKVYVAHLRQKLSAAGKPDLIHAVRGVGYVLRD